MVNRPAGVRSAGHGAAGSSASWVRCRDRTGGPQARPPAYGAGDRCRSGVTLVCAAVPIVALTATADRLGTPVSLPRAFVPVRNTGTADLTRTVRYATVDGTDLNL